MTEENRKPIRYMSVCSGIEAASIAWDYLGWEPFAFAEIEPFPCAVLASRWPHVLNLGDLTKISVQPNGDIKYGDEALGTAHVIPNDGRPIDIIIGGPPCQSFSIAGNQEGLRGVSGLSLDYIRLVYELAAYKGLRWFVHENVPNMLSCGKPKGSDYATLLSAFTGWDVDTPRNGWGNAGIIPPASAGNFGVAYRILDVQYTRVDGFPTAIPQRRRRVFTCGCLGSWERAAEILFEQRGLLGNQPPKRKKKQAVACTSGASTCGNDGVHASHGGVAEQEAEGGSGADKGDDACGRRNADGTGDGGITVFHGSQDPIHNDGACANALGRNQGQETCVCCGFQQNQVGEVREYETAPTLNTNSNASGRNSPLACTEEPFTGDVTSVIDASYYKGAGTRNGNERPLVLEGEKDAFNFEMFSCECKGVSPALQAQRAKDTLVYGTENTANQAEKFEP